MPEVVAAKPAGRRWSRLLKPGLLLLLLLGLVGFTVLHLRAVRSMDHRFEELKRDVDARRAEDAAPRSVRRGDPVVGNAVEHYLEAEESAEGLDMIQLSKALEAAQEGRPLSWDMVGKLEGYGAVTAHVRAGLRRTHCDWGFAYEEGLFAYGPSNLMRVRSVALLMLLQAVEAKDPGEAVGLALDVFCYGGDHARGATLIQLLISTAVRSHACRFLAWLVRTRPLPPAELQRIVDTLAAVGPIDRSRFAEVRHLVARVWLSGVSGRPLASNYATLVRDYGKRMTKPGHAEADALSSNDEIEGLVSRRLAIELDREWARLDTLEDAEDSPVATQVVLGFGFNSLRPDEALVGMVRTLAAAHLHRLEHGAFPASFDALKDRLGGLPRDPFRPEGEALTLAFAGNRLRVYSYYENHKDDGGVQDELFGEDFSLFTHAPSGD